MRVLLTICVLFLAAANGAFASGTADFLAAPQAAPAWFLNDGAGGFYGQTEAGEYFTQTVVFTNSVIHLERFAIGTAAFYISDRGIIVADSDLAALSQYLLLA